MSLISLAYIYINTNAPLFSAFLTGYRNPGDITPCGSKPGPLVRMAPGTRYKLTLHNSAEDSTVKTNIHTHGLHIAGSGDGDDITRFVSGGDCIDYTWDIPWDHPGGTNWYHPHYHALTVDQTQAGAAFGMLIIDDDYSQLNSWAHPHSELLLLVSDMGMGTSVLDNGNRNEIFQVQVGDWYRLNVNVCINCELNTGNCVELWSCSSCTGLTVDSQCIACSNCEWSGEEGTCEEITPVPGPSGPGAGPAPEPDASLEPSSEPSISMEPSSEPSISMGPSSEPSSEPSISMEPSSEPSPEHSMEPSSSSEPSSEHSMEPSESLQPSTNPSSEPSSDPSSEPSLEPSTVPSSAPSCAPSASPTEAPSMPRGVYLFYPHWTQGNDGCR